MASTMDSVWSTIGIDRVNMNGRMILIEENHGSNGNFLVNAVLLNALKKGHSVCLVLHHDTLAHYQNIVMRYGLNLMSLEKKGQVHVVEPMKVIISDIASIGTDTTDCLLMKSSKTESLQISPVVWKLFSLVKEKFDEAIKSDNSVLIVVDDLSHLLDLGLNIRDTMFYVRYLRSLMATQHLKTQLCITIHTYGDDVRCSDSTAIAASLRYVTDLHLLTKPLSTGYSTDASGKIGISWKVDSARLEHHWPEKAKYLYKFVRGWQVNIYAPGATS